MESHCNHSMGASPRALDPSGRHIWDLAFFHRNTQMGEWLREMYNERQARRDAKALEERLKMEKERRHRDRVGMAREVGCGASVTIAWEPV